MLLRNFSVRKFIRLIKQWQCISFVPNLPCWYVNFIFDKKAILIKICMPMDWWYCHIWVSWVDSSLQLRGAGVMGLRWWWGDSDVADGRLMWRWRHPPCYWPWTQPPSLPPTHLGYTRVGVGLPTLHPLHPQTLKVEPNEVKERSGSTQEEYSSNWDPTMIKPRRYTLIDGFDRWLMACQHRTINIAL